LSPFPPEDTLQYLNFRLRAVGYKGPDVFNKKTAGVVKKYSNGLTRRINIIADKSLLAAFSEGSHTITSTHVKSAAQDSEFKKIVDNKKLLMLMSALLLIVGALVAGFYLGKQELDKRYSMEQSSVPDMQQAETLSLAAVDSEQNEVPVPVPVVELITDRINSTKQWLEKAEDNHYSIQLFMARTSEADKVEAFLKDAPEILDFTKVYIYETVISGRSWYSVLYNDFATQEAAIDKLDMLPSSLKASDPYLRRLSALKKDITRNKQ
jgi:septal ring-binding cell division protein DamX